MRIRGTAARHGAVWNNTVRLSGTRDTAQTTNRVSRAYDIRFLSLGNPTGISIVSSAEPSGRPYKIRSRRRDGHSFSRHVVLAPVRPCGATVGRQRGRVSKFHGSPSRNPSHDECPPPPPDRKTKTTFPTTKLRTTLSVVSSRQFDPSAKSRVETIYAINERYEFLQFSRPVTLKLYYYYVRVVFSRHDVSR